MGITIPGHISSLTYAIAVLLASYICLRCYTSPNLALKSRLNAKDTLMNTWQGRFSFTFNRIVVAVLGPAYAWLSTHPPPAKSSWCPHPEHVNKLSIRWSNFTAVCILFMIVFGSIRISAYRQLGPGFTYELARPKKLVTTGLYRYIRHPSYSAKVLVAVPLTLFFLRDDGPAGCWLPPLVVRYRLLNVSIWVLKTIIALMMKESRVHEEEEMMAREFGDEWTEYAARTKRYIPFVF